MSYFVDPTIACLGKCVLQKECLSSRAAPGALWKDLERSGRALLRVSAKPSQSPIKAVAQAILAFRNVRQ